MLDALHWWGKARPVVPSGPRWHPLPYHMLDVAAVALRILEVRPSMRDRLCALAGLPPQRPESLGWLPRLTP